MRKIRFIFLIVTLILFTSCAENQPLYVRNMKIDYVGEEYTVTFEYYDFSSQEENFQTILNSGYDLEKLCISSIVENNFNFRLLENVCITPHILSEQINFIFYLLNGIKIPVTTNIVCFIGEGFLKEKSNLINTCLYNFSFDKGKVSGIVNIYDENGKYNGGLIVSNGKIVKYLDDNRWKVLNLLIGNLNDFTFKFRDGHISARLEQCDVYFHGNEEMNIEITAKLKDYNGISDTIMYKDMFLNFLENELENTVYRLYNDVVVSKECNLMWYCQYKNIDSDKINVNITVL